MHSAERAFSIQQSQDKTTVDDSLLGPPRSTGASLTTQNDQPDSGSPQGETEQSETRASTGFYDGPMLSTQYLSERRRYSSELRSQPGSLRRLAGASTAYLMRRMLWSFGFFPVVIAFWLPLVFARFNPVVMIDSLLPAMQSFVLGNPEAQAATMETILIAWFSIGFAFTVFDLILTPFKSPHEQSVDAHMRLWLRLHTSQGSISEVVESTAESTSIGVPDTTNR